MTTLEEMQKEAEKDTTIRRQILRLRGVKAVREVVKGKQRKLTGWNRCEGGIIK